MSFPPVCVRKRRGQAKPVLDLIGERESIFIKKRGQDTFLGPYATRPYALQKSSLSPFLILRKNKNIFQKEGFFKSHVVYTIYIVK
jgi:hypothetical protein